MIQRLLLGLLLCLSTLSFGQTIAVPGLTKRITDMTDTLTSAQLNALEQSIITFEQHNTENAQIAVLMLPSTGDDTIEQFAIRVFDQWKLGSKPKNNGVLILIAKNDRHVRIEIGYGLEGDVTDIQTGQIIRTKMLPAFQKGDYYSGIADSIASLTQLINKQGTTEVSNPSATPPEEEGLPVLVAIICYIIVKILIFLSRLFRRSTGNHHKNILFSSLLAPVLTWPFASTYFWLGQSFSLFSAMEYGLYTCVIVLIIDNLPFIRFIGGGGRGGGFGGGGGLSGGGGASGKW